jgi:hypothetical protein
VSPTDHKQTTIERRVQRDAALLTTAQLICATTKKAAQDFLNRTGTEIGDRARRDDNSGASRP